MSELLDSVRRRTRRWSTSSNFQANRYIPKSDSQIKLQLGDTTMVFNKEWTRESDPLENQIKELQERNQLLEGENSLLGFKLGLAMDMLAMAKLDLVSVSLGTNQ